MSLRAGFARASGPRVADGCAAAGFAPGSGPDIASFAGLGFASVSSICRGSLLGAGVASPGAAGLFSGGGGSVTTSTGIPRAGPEGIGASSRRTKASNRPPCASTEAAVILARRQRRSRAAAAGVGAAPENRSPRSRARFCSLLLSSGSKCALKGCLYKSPPLGKVSARPLRGDINLKAFRGPWRKQPGTFLASARRCWCYSGSNDNCRQA